MAKNVRSNESYYVASQWQLMGRKLRQHKLARISMIILAIHKHWFRPEFEGNLRGGKPSEGFSMFRIFAVFWAVSLFVQVFVAKFEWGPPTISTIAVSITAGFCEETVFRGLPLSLLMRRFARDRNMIAALIITSAVFGLTHGLNIFAGANAQRTVLQIIGAGFLGLLLGAVYLRSGSLWPVIVIHTAHDIIAFMDVSNVSETGVIIGKVTWQSYFDLGLGIAMGIIGIWLVRKARRDEIREIWEKKWRIRENEENAGYN